MKPELSPIAVKCLKSIRNSFADMLNALGENSPELRKGVWEHLRDGYNNISHQLLLLVSGTTVPKQALNDLERSLELVLSSIYWSHPERTNREPQEITLQRMRHAFKWVDTWSHQAYPPRSEA